MIKYIGSKRTLVPLLVEVMGALGGPCTTIDLFSGTSRVGHALKRAGHRVFSNDHNAYAATLATCYVQADRERIGAAAERILCELDALPGRAGYVTDTFCVKSRFFQPHNGERIDAIRDAIEAKDLEPELRAVLLVALMEAADRVDSTTGVQMAYLKQWAPRAHNRLALRMPDVLPAVALGRGAAWQLDALDAVEQLEGDICYIDPPYNQHKYLGNYHIWETLVRWDRPEVYGTACKRVDCRERTSAFNAKGLAHASLRRVIERVRARHLVVSFSDEGYISGAELEAMLRARGDVVVLERDAARYVGARIGIYNPDGEKVGKISHLRNTERIFVASQDRAVLARVQAVGHSRAGPGELFAPRASGTA